MIVRDTEIPYAFIHNPRTSGTSISEYLIKFCGGRILGNIPQYLTTHSIYAEEARYRNLDDHFKFGFIRNPWSREWTLYKLFSSRANTQLSFKSWVMNERTKFSNPQYAMFCDDNGLLKCNLYRFEQRSAAIKDIANIIRTDAAAFNSYKAGQGFNTQMQYVTDYDTEMIDRIQDLFKVDIEAFGYYFDGYTDTIKNVQYSFDGIDTMNWIGYEDDNLYINV